ncbi:hypothetical protein ACFXJ8_24370 [Nonomuraea sp. NPDC059194]|uniref:hypothetical protein n=1 Tax=Nonomuraea sp. NPDC059194 TaxID=3346764 RepID=UPI0036A9F509
MTSIERSAYPRFKRQITARELHRALIRQRVGLTYDRAQARKVAGEVIRTLEEQPGGPDQRGVGEAG